ncbi:hypothetical protein BDV98DRAFT_562463 [Pterulicium gracile]|uniref:PRISE-like Rossmann-fold domain-containing protein n=1 Tax=Pterulicium gracile TaxID=1884261 RepID=A0A5C3QVM1_9AGAR|nr:hypothetical protein BDV98DRAFT_562463 [Pterula gracilis]
MEDSLEECKVNCAMMERVAGAVSIIAPNLEAFVYSGGTRGYGIYVPGGTFTAPLEESMADNLPHDYAKTVAYPHFRKILAEAAGGTWTWTEICPDAVVGFTPGGSGFSLALHWAQYLSLYRYQNSPARGSGPVKKLTVEFPGVEAAYHASFTPVSTQTFGRIAIHAALHQDQCAGKVINAADRARPTSWQELWPQIVDWFGMVGVGPSNNVSPGNASLKPGAYVEKYKHLFQERGMENAITCGVGAGSKQLDSVGSWLTFDRQLSLERLRSVGFVEEIDPAKGWAEAFQRFREAGIIL